MRLCAAFCIAVAAVIIAAGGEAGAAVRVCKPVVSGGFAAGETELETRKQALDAWKTKALEHGEQYASWRLAADKFLECLPRQSGGFECIARAAPCTIDQAPSRRELRSKRLGI